jgi:hypothetical protein
MFYRLLLFSIALLLLASCGAQPGGILATPLPDRYIPTAIALTIAADSDVAGVSYLPAPVEQALEEEASPPTAVPEPSATPAATMEQPEAEAAATLALSPGLMEVTLTPTPLPAKFLESSPTPTATPGVPESKLQIYKPGHLSRVSSPLRISGYLVSGNQGEVHVDLYGEDGRVLYSAVKDYGATSGWWLNMNLDIEFEIPGVAEVGRLVIGTYDDFGRPMALNSVNLILLSMGQSDITPSDCIQERIVIDQPVFKGWVQGGAVVVAGKARTTVDGPLTVRILDESGASVGEGQILEFPADGSYHDFSVQIPYTVSTYTSVRLVIYEDGEGLSEFSYLTSREFMLSP